jgi:hypothetical protein
LAIEEQIQIFEDCKVEHKAERKADPGIEEAKPSHD